VFNINTNTLHHTLDQLLTVAEKGHCAITN